MRSGVMVGSPVWVWLVVWCLVCVASAGYIVLAVVMAVVCLPVRPCSWCRRWAAACVRGWVPFCVAVAVGVGALGAW